MAAFNDVLHIPQESLRNVMSVTCMILRGGCGQVLDTSTWGADSSGRRPRGGGEGANGWGVP